MRHAAPLLAAIALLAACGDPTSTATAPVDQVRASQAGLGRDVNRDLATLRRVTAPFHNFEQAQDAGWLAKITPCMTNPAEGGMGFHYGNVGLIDGAVAVDEPELLLYEPQKNGRLRLVAVEYIVPLSAWTSSQPPRLFGRDFHVNEMFQVWALHAWVWKENPSGMFADWNPLVSCEYTDDVLVVAAGH